MNSRIATFFLTAALLFAALAGEGEGAMFRDAAGREVEIVNRPERIVSLAPNLTEILFALDLGGEVAGVTIFCDWPDAAREKPKIGGFINPSLEAIVSLNPDLVLATADGNRQEDVARLESLGKTVFVVDTRSIDDITGSILVIGRLTGREKQAGEVVAGMRRRLDRVREAVRGRSPLTVFVALDRNPLITAGKGTFIDELVTLAGGRNIVDSPVVKYPVFNLEQLLSSDPEVIVAATGTSTVSREEAVDRWRALPGGAALQAVKSGRIFEVGEGSFFRPGPRIIGSLERLKSMFFPGSGGP